ncbi:hypothetical protein T484DRAFT_1786609 [Baffinella frigidus]|nr:hypothetical protein T484DRAFT_1786609 [Cryptophyta sp. CCMP2293]
MGGCCEGLAGGLVCKPTSGFLDLIANTTEGLRNQTNPSGKPLHSRLREPRALGGPEGALRSLHAPPLPHALLLERLATQSSSLPSLGGDLVADTCRSHMVVTDGVLLFTGRHCVWAPYNTRERASFCDAGLNGALSDAQVRACLLGWHVQWKDLGGLWVEGDTLVIQADSQECATWDRLRLEGLGSEVEQACHTMHDAWRWSVEDAEGAAEIVA